MRLFLVIACALGIYVALLLRKVLAIQRDTPLVIFLAMPYLLQLTLGLLTKSQWSLRIHSIGMLVLCFVEASSGQLRLLG